MQQQNSKTTKHRDCYRKMYRQETYCAMPSHPLWSCWVPRKSPSEGFTPLGKEEQKDFSTLQQQSGYQQPLLPKTPQSLLRMIHVLYLESLWLCFLLRGGAVALVRLAPKGPSCGCALLSKMGTTPPAV